jgi:hypothetical protein
LLNGHLAERTEKDYGYDLVVFTFNDKGEFENGQINLQLKATDSLEVLKDGKTITFSIRRADYNQWRHEPMPVFLIIYDAQNEKSYWLYFQAYCEKRNISLPADQGEITVHISTDNVVDKDAIAKFREYKIAVLRQIEQGAIHHDE